MKPSEIGTRPPATQKPIGSDPVKALQAALKAETERTTKLEKALAVAIDALIEERKALAGERLKTTALIYALDGSPLIQRYNRRHEALLGSSKVNIADAGNNKLKKVRPQF